MTVIKTKEINIASLANTIFLFSLFKNIYITF